MIGGGVGKILRPGEARQGPTPDPRAAPPPTDWQMVEQHLQPLWPESCGASRCPHTFASPLFSNISVFIG